MTFGLTEGIIDADMSKSTFTLVVIVPFAIMVGGFGWLAYKTHEYFSNLPAQWRQERINGYVKSATTSLKYINAGEKGIGCMELKFAYLGLVEIDAAEAEEIGKGYKSICG